VDVTVTPYITVAYLHAFLLFIFYYYPTMNVVDNAVQIVVCFTVKAFLAQAKEEFTKKWDEPPQVCRLVSIGLLVTSCEFVIPGVIPHRRQGRKCCIDQGSLHGTLSWQWLHAVKLTLTHDPTSTTLIPSAFNRHLCQQS